MELDDMMNSHKNKRPWCILEKVKLKEPRCNDYSRYLNIKDLLLIAAVEGHPYGSVVKYSDLHRFMAKGLYPIIVEKGKAIKNDYYMRWDIDERDMGSDYERTKKYYRRRRKCGLNVLECIYGFSLKLDGKLLKIPYQRLDCVKIDFYSNVDLHYFLARLGIISPYIKYSFLDNSSIILICPSCFLTGESFGILMQSEAIKKINFYTTSEETFSHYEEHPIPLGGFNIETEKWENSSERDNKYLESVIPDIEKMKKNN